MKKLLLLALISPVALADTILCTGMSNAMQECADWIQNNATGHEIINGAVGGFDIVRIHNNPDDYWSRVMQQIARSGFTPADIDIIWNKNATRASSGDQIGRAHV